MNRSLRASIFCFIAIIRQGYAPPCYFFSLDPVLQHTAQNITILPQLKFFTAEIVMWHAICVWKFFSFYIMTCLLLNLTHSAYILFLWDFFFICFVGVLRGFSGALFCPLSHDVSLFFQIFSPPIFLPSLSHSHLWQ